ncbi:MAG TPA: radical SAM protein [Syntrophomonadaceae bacterium]|nr:radical SAM protein [Syntrophomonadaceae bacterium]
MALNLTKLMEGIYAQARENGSPVNANFELTSRCNLKCKMCYVCRPVNDQDAKSQELTAKQWIQLAREARDAGVLTLTLTGGEVFLRQDFKEIYEALARMGFILQIYTNGTIITPDIVKWLSKIPPSRVSITLYGGSAETCANVTGYAYAYDRMLRAVDLLNNAGILTEMKTTVIRDNIADFDSIYQLAQDRKLKFGIVNYVSPRREGSFSDPEGCRLSPSELDRFERRVKQINRERRENEEEVALDDAVAHDEGPLYKQAGEHDAKAFRCAAGSTGFWITWDGKMTPCGLMDKPATDPVQQGVKAAWETLKQHCRLIPTCETCLQCEYYSYCDSCPGRLLTESGCYTRPAPYLCETARLRSVKID